MDRKQRSVGRPVDPMVEWISKIRPSVFSCCGKKRTTVRPDMHEVLSTDFLSKRASLFFMGSRMGLAPAEIVGGDDLQLPVRIVLENIVEFALDGIHIAL